MKGNISIRVVWLSLGLLLLTTMPKSNGLFQNPSSQGNFRGNNPVDNVLSESPNARSTFTFEGGVANDLRGLLSPQVESLPVTTSSPSTPFSTPPSTPSSTPPPSTPPPGPPPCPLTAAQCNFPACSAIPGCSQCQTASNGNGIICLRCCTGFALRTGGLFCDSCSQVTNCRTCNSADNGDSSVICQSCCPGFGLNLQLGPGSTPMPARCDSCSAINACTSCTDGNTALFSNDSGGDDDDDDDDDDTADLTCTGCASGFTLNQGTNMCDP